MASHVHVAHASNAIMVQTLEHAGGVEAMEHVIVPGITVSVHEDGGIWEVVIVVDNVGEIDLGRC